jgi:cytochrome b pre-mRNA-processing protein 3
MTGLSVRKIGYPLEIPRNRKPRSPATDRVEIGKRLDKIGRPLNPIPFFRVSRRDDSAAKLYGSIVAQARLPVFYQGVGVPDTLQGRFVVLSLQLFAVLHRLRAEGPAADALVQDLVDRFGADMETVLREIGIGDLSIPKKVRALAASSGTLLHAYAEALAEGEGAIAAVIAKALPLQEGASGAVAERLAHYLSDSLSLLHTQDFAALEAGEMRFPGTIPGVKPGEE